MMDRPALQPFRAAFDRTLRLSAYVSRVANARPGVVEDLQRREASAFGRDEMRAALAGDPETLAPRLRQLRERVMVTLAHRDLNGLASLDEVFATMTALAEESIAAGGASGGREAGGGGGPRGAGRGGVRPLVSRRYLDYGMLEALRELHSRIFEAATRRRKADDIKVGAGGIREIEFAVQLFQMVRGGRDPALRTTSTRIALAALAQRGLIDAPRAAA